jgi:hypothetical protein
MLDNGADLDSAIVSVGDRLARDRGSSDVDGARWACAVLGYAVGRVPAHVEERLRDRAELHSSSSPTTAPATTVPQPGPAQSPPVGPSVPDRSRRWPVAAVVAVCVATVVAVGAIVAAVLLVGRDDEGGADPSEEVAEETAFTAAPSGTEVRLRMTHSGSAAVLVMDVMRDGDFERVDEVTLSCEYWPGSTNPDLTADQDVEGLPPDAGQGMVGWRGPDPQQGYLEYFGWNAAEGTLQLFGFDGTCPAEA